MEVGTASSSTVLLREVVAHKALRRERIKEKREIKLALIAF